MSKGGLRRLLHHQAGASLVSTHITQRVLINFVRDPLQRASMYGPYICKYTWLIYLICLKK